MRILSFWLGVFGAGAALVVAADNGSVTVAMSQYDYGRTGANLQ